MLWKNIYKHSLLAYVIEKLSVSRDELWCHWFEWRLVEFVITKNLLQ